MVLGGGLGVAFPVIAEDQKLARLALTWLDGEQTARLLVDDQLSIHWGNAVAQSWLDARRPIASAEGRLCLGRFNQELRDLLARARRKPEGTCVPLEKDDSHLLISARLVDSDGENRVFGLTMRRTDEVRTEKVAKVSKAFGLTPSESRVLQLLFRGTTAQEAAHELGVAVDTVRTHIRRLYQKVGVGSREALFKRVRPFMIAV